MRLSTKKDCLDILNPEGWSQSDISAEYQPLRLGRPSETEGTPNPRSRSRDQEPDPLSSPWCSENKKKSHQPIVQPNVFWIHITATSTSDVHGPRDADALPRPVLPQAEHVVELQGTRHRSAVVSTVFANAAERGRGVGGTDMVVDGGDAAEEGLPLVGRGRAAHGDGTAASASGVAGRRRRRGGHGNRRG